MNDSPEVRIGDADREQALHALGEHMSAGRLDVDEYGERSAKVTAAKTRSEPTEIFGDLPEPHPKFGSHWATVAQPAPGQPVAWSDRPLNQRLVSSLIPLLFVGALIGSITTGIWWFMALPVLATAFGRAAWGREWEAQARGNRDRHRERRRDLRDRRRP